MACRLSVVAIRISGSIGIVSRKENRKIINIDNLEDPILGVSFLVNDKNVRIVSGEKLR